MNRYERMTKAELLAELARISNTGPAATDVGRAECERDTYAAELEIQNRELRSTQQMLEDSRDVYADLYDFAPIAYANLAPSGLILGINLTGAQMLGRERARLVGFPLVVFAVQEDVSRVVRHVADAFRLPDRMTRTELSLQRHDGTYLAVELVSRVGRADGKKVLRTAIVDLTDRRKAAAESDRRLEQEARRVQAEDANATKDAFLATLSHELRTPLAAIQSWLYVMRMKPEDQELHGRGLQVIDGSVRAQLQLVEDLLDVSRIEHGKLKLVRKHVCVQSIVANTIATLRATAEQKQIILELHADEDADQAVEGDEARLQQVVSNLLANAIKFTPLGGRVELRLSCHRNPTGQPERAVLAVTDTGEGITPSLLPHVFDRFRQADASTRRAHAGLGLGLSIARHIVGEHDGTIRAESEGPGKGATFTVELPISGVGKPTTPEPVRVDDLPPEALRGVRVLTVDDDATSREAVALSLQACGADVTAVTSANEAIAALDQVQPDVIISDLAMPNADGFDLIKKLRRRAAASGGSTPTIALTAYAAPTDRERALNAGYDAYLAKPCPPAKLTTQVWRLAKERRAHGHDVDAGAADDRGNPAQPHAT